MYKVDNSTATASQPTRGAAGVKPNAFFQDSITGGTIVPADFMNAVQNELSSVVTGSGGSLDKADDTQVFDQIVKMLKGTTPSIYNPFMNYAHYREEQTSGTNSASTVGTSWTTRVLNEEKTDTIGISLAANQLTIPAGSYRVKATAIYGASPNSDAHKLKLYDTTGGGTDLVYGMTNRDYSGGASVMTGEFTLGASSAIELQHIATRSLSGGTAITKGTEVYVDLEFWKLD